MAESDAWANLRAYASAPTAPLDAGAPPGNELTEAGPTPDPAPNDATPGPGPQPHRRFNPGAIGPALDHVLPAGLVDRAARIPTPGGLFPLVAALLFFLLAIVPVDAAGHTRLEMLWRVLTHGASLPASGAAAGTTLDQFAAVTQATAADIAAPVLGTTPQNANTLFQTWWGLAGSLIDQPLGGG